MKIFVTGATGVLGRPTSRLLIDAGYSVRALVTHAGSESRLSSSRIEASRGSVFDPSYLREAVRGCTAILHLATRIPVPEKATERAAWYENDRLRAEGTRNLVQAAIEAGISTFIYPGVVFVYPDSGSKWIDAATAPQPAEILKSSLVAESEVERFSRLGKRGIVLRMGAFYGPTAGATRSMLHMTHYHVAMVFGRSTAYQPLIWVDDAALAIIDGLAKAPAGIYDIVDDEPLQRREFATALADAVDRRWLWRPPTILYRLFSGKQLMYITRSQRVSNRKFKDETGWSPMVPSARLGLRLSAVQP